MASEQLAVDLASCKLQLATFNFFALIKSTIDKSLEYQKNANKRIPYIYCLSRKYRPIDQVQFICDIWLISKYKFT